MAVVDLQSYIMSRRARGLEATGRSSRCAESTTAAAPDFMAWGLSSSFAFIGLLAIANMGFWCGCLRTWQGMQIEARGENGR